MEDMKEKMKVFFGKFKNVGKFFSKNKKNLIVCASVVMICGAVYLNYSLFHEPKDQSAGADAPGGDTQVVSPVEEYFSSAAALQTKSQRRGDGCAAAGRRQYRRSGTGKK